MCGGRRGGWVEDDHVLITQREPVASMHLKAVLGSDGPLLTSIGFDLHADTNTHTHTPLSKTKSNWVTGCSESMGSPSGSVIVPS